jgi:TatD DNase family protein
VLYLRSMLHFIDSHAHLYLEQFEHDRSDVIANAISQGVSQVILPNIDLDTIEGMEMLEDMYPNVCFATMGLHPCSAETGYRDILRVMETHIGRRTWTAIGETGLDLHWDDTYIEEQKKAFRIQLDWAKELRIPIIIHSRASTDLCIEEVKAAQDGRLTGVFHCFGESYEQAEQIIDLGMHLGIGGVVTYKKAGLDQVLPRLGLDYLVLETDSPYLAPTPHRGKRNESSYIPLVAQKIADYLHMPIEEVARRTTDNAIALFHLPIVQASSGL